MMTVSSATVESSGPSSQASVLCDHGTRSGTRTVITALQCHVTRLCSSIGPWSRGTGVTQPGNNTTAPQHCCCWCCHSYNAGPRPSQAWCYVIWWSQETLLTLTVHPYHHLPSSVQNENQSILLWFIQSNDFIIKWLSCDQYYSCCLSVKQWSGGAMVEPLLSPVVPVTVFNADCSLLL